MNTAATPVGDRRDIGKGKVWPLGNYFVRTFIIMCIMFDTALPPTTGGPWSNRSQCRASVRFGVSRLTALYPWVYVTPLREPATTAARQCDTVGSNIGQPMHSTQAGASGSLSRPLRAMSPFHPPGRGCPPGSPSKPCRPHVGRSIARGHGGQSGEGGLTTRGGGMLLNRRRSLCALG